MPEKNIFAYIKWLFKTSTIILDGEKGFSSWKLQLKIILALIKNKHHIKTMLQPKNASTLENLFIERPVFLGIVIWPYLCSSWDAKARIEKISNHCLTVDRLKIPYKFKISQSMVLIDLDHQYEGLRLVLDQPSWFLREGLLVVNLFVNDFRAFSLAFSLYTKENGETEAYIGAIQGRNTKNILDIYRQLTKSFHGIRPRDLIIILFQQICAMSNIFHIFAVADNFRHRRHPFFKMGINEKFSLNYNQVWEENEGIVANEQFYEFPLTPRRRVISEVKSKKRSMYRKRYQLLDDIEMELKTHFTSIKATEIDDK